MLMFNSCYYDNEEYLYGVNTCDTLNTSYSARVNPIIEANCFPCHTQDVGNGGVVLEGYESLINYTGDGTLLCVINQEAGCEPMPKNRPKLSDCDIQAITKWIANGSQNN